MKQQLLGRWNFLVLLVALPLASGCFPSPEQKVAEEPKTDPALVFQPVPEHQEVALEETEEEGPSDGRVSMISTDKPLPLALDPTAALAQFIKLADSGVEEEVLLSYVQNTATPFHLGPDEIIFLNDIGIPPTVVTAMLEHDSVLKQRMAEATAAWDASSDLVGAEQYAGAWPAYSPLPDAPPFEEVMPVDYPVDSYEPAPEPEPSAGASYFYDSLAPYGTWMDVEGYGKCWQPSVVVINKSWRPYCDRGRWIYSDCGWYWNSDYSWGWAPFHYGRWFNHTKMGWCWTPDTVWAPSWVSWRYSNDYCGWAPLPPRACYTGSGFTYYGRTVTANFSFGLGADCYTFIPFNRFHERHVSRHAVHRDQANRVFERTVASTKISGGNRTAKNHGLAPEQVAAATRKQIHRATIREATPATVANNRLERLEDDGRTLTVFRPQWQRTARTPASVDPSTMAAPTQVAHAQSSRQGSRAPGMTLPSSRVGTPRSPSEPNQWTGSAAVNPVQAPSPAQPVRRVLPTRDIRTGDITVAQPVEAQPVSSAPATLIHQWERPRRTAATAATAAAIPPALPATSLDPIQVATREQSSQRQAIRSSQAARANNPAWVWQPAGSESQSDVQASEGQRANVWHTPTRINTGRTPVNDDHQATVAPAPAYAAPAPNAGRWERPRQEMSRPTDTIMTPRNVPTYEPPVVPVQRPQPVQQVEHHEPRQVQAPTRSEPQPEPSRADSRPSREESPAAAARSQASEARESRGRR